MSHTPHQDRSFDIYWRVLPLQRSYQPLLWHFEALSEQRPLAPTDDVPYNKRAGQLRIRCYHDDAEYYEGHGCGKRRLVQGERDPSA